MIIRRLFEQRLAAWSDGNAFPVAWENVPFKPPAGLYLSAFLLRAPTDSRDLSGSHRLYRGVFQVNVIAPVGGGAGPAESVAQQVVDLFPKEQPLTGYGLSIALVSPMSMHMPIQGADRYTVPCSCRYQSHEYRPTA